MVSARSALALYAALSLLLFGLPILRDPSRLYVGTPADPTAFAWFLAWWPHALATGRNLFVTDLVWAPVGYNLAWTTSVPGLSLVMAPLTLVAGPLVTYNVLALAAPASSAWTAFLLCRQVTGAPGPALAGGYLFGFSTYMLGQLTGHLHVVFVPLVPLVPYLVLRRLAGFLQPRAFMTWLAIVLAAQFSISNEVFATLTLFGGLALTLGALVAPVAMRRRIAGTAAQIGVAYAVAGVLLAPYLYYVFARGVPGRPIHDPRVHSADLLNILVPTPITLLGGNLFRPVADRFLGNYGESTAYLGLALVALLVAYAREEWGHPRGRVLLGLLVAALVASLGPKLNLLGESTVSLPWRPVLKLPLIKHALPVRLTLYVFLVAAVIVAIWLRRGGRGWRGGLAGLALVMLLPNVPGGHWRSEARVPDFFTRGEYRQHFRPGELVLQLPADNRADGMFWQVEANLSYRMPAGYIGAVPPEFLRWPVVPSFMTALPVLDAARQFQAFVGAHGVQTVIVGEGSGAPWEPLAASLGVPPLRVGGVILYRVPPEVHARYGARDAEQMEQRARFAQFAFLLDVADEFLARGGTPEELTPRKAQGMALIPPHWGGYRSSGEYLRRGDHHWTKNGLWLGALGEDGVAVGVVGTLRQARPIIDHYLDFARQAIFPYRASPPTPVGKDQALLVMVFDREGLARAARHPW